MVSRNINIVPDYSPIDPDPSVSQIANTISMYLVTINKRNDSILQLCQFVKYVYVQNRGKL